MMELSDAVLDSWTTGQRLQRAVYDAGFTNLDFCRGSGIPEQTFYRIVRGERVGTLDTWLRMSGYLGMPLSAIVEPWVLRGDVPRA